MRRPEKARPKSSTPRRALELLRDPEVIEYASNPYSNPAWMHASMSSKGRDNQTVAEAFERQSPKVLAERVANVLSLPTQDLREAVPALKVKEIPREDRWTRPFWDQSPAQTRRIVIPCVLRRALSNLVRLVLEATSDHLLAPEAIAYRGRARDVVQVAILDAAEEVTKGRYFYAKLDIKNCFPSLPWEGVREALAALGFPEELVDVVMALVQAPRERLVNGRWVEDRVDRGCEAGLAESAVLLNLFFRDLDRQIRGEVFYRRYSDDLLVIGSDRQEVITAVKVIKGWVEAHGLKLKGVLEGQHAASLVNDIRKSPLTFLGATVTADGDVHIPEEKVVDHLRKLAWMIRRIPDGSTVAATSKLVPGAHAVWEFDLLDVHGALMGFHDYWHRLNAGEAEAFLSVANRELGLWPQHPGRGGRKTWVASLAPVPLVGGHRNRREASGLSHHLWILDAISRVDSLSVKGGDLLGEDAWELEVGWLLEEESERLDSRLADEMVGPAEFYSNGTTLRVGEEELSGEDSPYTYMRFAPRSPCREALSDHQASGEGAPPTLPRRSRKTKVVHLVHRWDPSLGRQGGAVVGVQETVLRGDDACEGSPALQLFPDVEAVPAAVDMMLHRLHVAAAQDVDEVVFVLETAWLPKQLLQGSRKFRSVGLFRRLLRLHALAGQLGIKVAMVGPAAMPEKLTLLLADALRPGAQPQFEAADQKPAGMGTSAV